MSSQEVETRLNPRKGQIIVFKEDVSDNVGHAMPKGAVAKITRKSYTAIKCCGPNGKPLFENCWVYYYTSDGNKGWRNNITILPKRHPMLKGMTEDEILSSKFIMSSDGDIIGVARNDGSQKFDLAKPTPLKTTDFSSMRKMIERN